MKMTSTVAVRIQQQFLKPLCSTQLGKTDELARIATKIDHQLMCAHARPLA